MKRTDFPAIHGPPSAINMAVIFLAQGVTFSLPKSLIYLGYEILCKMLQLYVQSHTMSSLLVCQTFSNAFCKSSTPQLTMSAMIVSCFVFPFRSKLFTITIILNIYRIRAPEHD